MIEKQDHIDDEDYRRWVATLPCLITEKPDVQAAHIRYGAQAGLGRKPSDERIVPLSCSEHAWQHEIGELKYWYKYGGWEVAVVFAAALYAVRYDTPAAIQLMKAWRQRWVIRDRKPFLHTFIVEPKPQTGD